MNDNDASNASHRWWLNPALAQLAFGASTRSAQATAVSPALAMEQALLHAGLDLAGLDLEDPAQREFGDYELLELIGHGGMGVVYRARQRDLDREVAIKLFSAGQSVPEEFVDGLRREAQHAAHLQHPNIVVVHKMGEQGRPDQARMHYQDALAIVAEGFGEAHPDVIDLRARLRALAGASPPQATAATTP